MRPLLERQQVGVLALSQVISKSRPPLDVLNAIFHLRGSFGVRPYIGHGSPPQRATRARTPPSGLLVHHF